jgi:hypothetical protein
MAASAEWIGKRPIEGSCLLLDNSVVNRAERFFTIEDHITGGEFEASESQQSVNSKSCISRLLLMALEATPQAAKPKSKSFVVQQALQSNSIRDICCQDDCK